MRQRFAVALLLGACAPLARADVIELSPELYLAVGKASIGDSVVLKVKVIAEANKFAASKDRVAVPVTGRLTILSTIQLAYDYQFRLMTRAEALTTKPVLADAVVVVDARACEAPATPTAAALISELGELDALLGLGLPPPSTKPSAE